jgi:hypothetical protein
MRKFFLISAMVLASATAQAGQSRNLSPVAANDEQPVVTTTTTQSPRAAEADTSRIPVESTPTLPTPPAPPVASSPSYEERPSAVTPTTTTAPPLANPPTTTTTTVTPPAKADAPRRTAKAGRRGRGGYWTEARIIGELHRYGIYW